MTGAGGRLLSVIDRVIARIPVLLLVLPLVALAWVALPVEGRPGLLLAGVPSALLLLAYLRSGAKGG